MLVLLGLLLVYAAAVFIFLFAMIFFVLWISLEAGELDLSFYFAAAGLLTVCLCVFGSVMTTQSALYRARDNELLLSMPVRPSHILLSRLLFLWMINTLFSMIVALPALAVYILCALPSIPAILSFGFFLLLFSLLGLAISCLLGFLVAIVTARLKHKNIISLLFMLLFFGFYFWGMSALGSGAEQLEAIDIRPLVTALTPYLTPFLWVGQAILYGDIVAGALFLLLFALVVGLASFFLLRTYTRILTTNRGGVQYTYREKKEKQCSATVALVKKELAHFFGNATYMMNEGLGLLFALGIGIYTLIGRENLLAQLATMEIEGLSSVLPALAAGVLCLCGSMTMISAPSVSLEGKNVWLAQSLPISGGTALRAKAYAHITVATPFFLIASILCIIATGAGLGEAVGLILLPFAFNLFSAYLGVTLNILFPKLDWVNEAYAVKSGIAVMLTMFGMMLLGGILLFALFILSLLGFPTFVIMLAAATILFGLSAALHAYLGSGGAKRFAALS